MCFRPADVGDMFVKVKCEECGEETLAGINCTNCGHFNEKPDAPDPAAFPSPAPGAPAAPAAPSAPAAPKAPMPPKAPM